MKVDGSAGKAGCGAGIILENKEGLRLEHAIHFNFQTTNNVAEYKALIAVLELAKKLGIEALYIFTDSQLIANQVEGAYEVKDQGLKGYKEIAIESMKQFSHVKVNLVKRENIAEADAFAKLGASKSTEEDKWIQIRTLPYSSIQKSHENLEIIALEEDWGTPLKEYISGNKIPTNKLEAKMIKNQAANYVLQDGDLFRREARTGTFPLRTCVPIKEGKK